MSTGKTYLNDFRGSAIKMINHIVTPTLVEDKPDVVIIIHVGFNDATKQNKNILNASKLGDSIITVLKTLSYHQYYANVASNWQK